MIYYISVDIGVVWEDMLNRSKPLSSWGVSTRQKKNAEKIQKGDILLHYINHVQVWAGYSIVGGPVTSTSHDEHADWRAALPWTIPIETGKYLSRSQCQVQYVVKGISGVKDRHRQRAFTVVPGDEVKLIVGAIDHAATNEGTFEDPKFDHLWKQGADAYYGDIRKVDNAKCKCEACGNDGLSWSKKHLNGHLRPGDREAPSDWFLEAAHIEARSDGGAVTPDNIRALCRNCHHIIDRLPKEEKLEFMRSLPSPFHMEALKHQNTKT
jgi:hypothetical protein